MRTDMIFAVCAGSEATDGGNLNYRSLSGGRGAKFPQTFETCFFGWMGMKLPIMSAGLEILLAGRLQMS